MKTLLSLCLTLFCINLSHLAVAQDYDLPDYSVTSDAELRELVKKGDSHAEFTIGYNYIFSKF